MKAFAEGNNANRWSFYNGGNPVDNAGTTETRTLNVLAPSHPAFATVGSGPFDLFNTPPYTPNTVWYFGGTTTTFQYISQRFNAPDMSGTNGVELAEFQGAAASVMIGKW